MSTTYDLIRRAFAEDIGPGDITTLATVPRDAQANGVIAAKQELVVSGLEAAKLTFETLDSKIKWKAKKQDGDLCKNGDVLGEVEGSAGALLTAERVALNFLQHLSGIATITHRFVKAVEGTGVKIVDTRKTMPGLRELEKQAVLHGGGENHRMGLYDRYLIKNNHIDIAGNVNAAIKLVKEHRKDKNILIEVEVRNDEELAQVLADGVDIVMLDNWPIDKIDAAIEKVAGRSKIELSGGINLDNIKDCARKGIDYISVGALTHSAPAVDIHSRII